MNVFRRFDAWQPSSTWWILGTVVVGLAIADILDIANFDHEITGLGSLLFLCMVVELILSGRRAARAGEAARQ